MFSKFILNSNWTGLSSNYKFDNTIDLYNTDITVTGNTNLTYTSYLSNLNDYANNNYSLLFLTKKLKLNNILNTNPPIDPQNRQVCLLANKLENDLIGEETVFLNLSSFKAFNTINILNLTDDSFFEIDFLSSNELLLLTVKDRVSYYMCVDDLNLAITVIQKNELEALNVYELDKIKLNYIYDSKKNNIILYRIIRDQTYVISVLNNNIILKNSDLSDRVLIDDIFTLLKIKDLPSLKLNANIISYKTNIDKNNLSIRTSRSVDNNYIAHLEYNNIDYNYTNTNFLTLKNQLNIKDELRSNKDNNNFRDYKSIFIGGSREEGYENINLGFASSYYPITLYSDKTTWFHVPYNLKGEKLEISDSTFIQNGAIAGNSPIFSDKIYKKSANYATTSNMGNVEDTEQNGVWLCAWLSGGSTSKQWVDRFFNKSSFTPYEALTYSSNVNYTPQYEGKRGEGITDIPSKLTLEPGAWYAYSRMGKKTGVNILSGNKDIISNSFTDYRSKTKAKKPIELDIDSSPIYNLNNDSYGIINTENLNYYNNLGLSFFATREDWGSSEYSLLGNYMDTGMGWFFNRQVYPLNYYINDKTVYVLNNRFQKLLTIDCSFFLPGQDFTIVGLFKRDFNNNIHIVTSNNNIIELNSNGTIVDLLSVQKLFNDSIKSIYNNIDNGYILYGDGKILKINLYSNIYEEITNNVIFSEGFSFNSNVIADSFNFVYVINGLNPIIKGTNIYYKNPNKNTIDFFNTNTETISSYLSASKLIMGYNFDKDENTYVLLEDKVLVYDAKGVYTKEHIISTNNIETTGYNITFQNLNKTEQCNISLIDKDNNNYFYNLNTSSYVKIDSVKNNRFNRDSNLYNDFMETSNWSYIQSIIQTTYPLPTYTFKVRLFNQFDYEDYILIKTDILAENLNTGTHHFAVNLDTINGLYSFYIDGNLYNIQNFEPAKYSFSNLFNNNIIVGTVPYYGGLVYSDFYKSDDLRIYVDDLKIEKFKIAKNIFSQDEIKLLYYEKYSPKDLVIDLPVGERNYIDTISRTFKHKMKGSKSNLINLVINDSLVTDEITQRKYQMLILNKLKTILPGYIKINSIQWKNNKDNDEKMLQGNFNLRNTLTNNIE
jgi:hypothetical protein